MSDIDPTSVEKAVIEGKEKGYEPIQSSPVTLLLDLDTIAAVRQYKRVLPVIQQQIAVSELRCWESKSGNHHVELLLGEPLPVYERLLLQAALGSDGVKEALSWRRVKSGISEPSLLFKPKNEAKARYPT